MRSTITTTIFKNQLHIDKVEQKKHKADVLNQV
jgi:hypothetical protein